MTESDGQVLFTVEMDDTGFQNGMARLQSALAALGVSVQSAFTVGQAQLNEAYQSGKKWVTSFGLGMRASNDATTAAQAVVNNAASAAYSAGHAGGVSAGGAIVSVMASGVSAMGGALNAALVRIVNSALAAARRAAGISSPSKLFRDQVGRYLALGVGDGFTGTMAASVLPAISQSVRGSAAVGQQALNGTLLTAAARAAGTQAALPDWAGAGTLTLLAAAVPVLGGAQAVAGESGPTTVTQNITFQSVMQAPDEVARAIRRQATHGLAGARG